MTPPADSTRAPARLQETVPGGERPRILYVSFLPPIPTWGTSFAYYRHFVERDDFSVKVATNAPRTSPLFRDDWCYFEPSRTASRIMRTRLLPYLYGLHLLTAFGRVPGNLKRFAADFAPDAVFTVAGSWDYSALIAQRIARGLGVPLIASFNDWFDFGWYPVHKAYSPLLEARFRRFYREADLALCTSEGMREELGAHPNAHILYPLGSVKKAASGAGKRAEGKPLIVGYGGNLGEWYGPMVESFCTEARTAGLPWEFRLCGSNPNWSADFRRYCDERGFYKGQVSFEELGRQMEGCDVLLLPMGFDSRSALYERTSFKTKFLDYLSFAKPIVVWGPGYCSAVRTAREFDSAELCTEPSPASALRIVSALAASPERQSTLVENADLMYRDRFHPDKIHAGLVAAIKATLCAHKERR